MNQAYIDALVNQALDAYKAGGDEGLAKWKKDLPAPHLAEFEKHCAGPLREAIEALQVADPAPKPPPIPKPPAPKPMELGNPRKKHTRDRRRTKPL